MIICIYMWHSRLYLYQFGVRVVAWISEVPAPSVFSDAGCPLGTASVWPNLRHFYSDNSIDMLNNDMAYSWQDGEQ